MLPSCKILLIGIGLGCWFLVLAFVCTLFLRVWELMQPVITVVVIAISYLVFWSCGAYCAVMSFLGWVAPYVAEALQLLSFGAQAAFVGLRATVAVVWDWAAFVAPLVAHGLLVGFDFSVFVIQRVWGAVSDVAAFITQ